MVSILFMIYTIIACARTSDAVPLQCSGITTNLAICTTLMPRSANQVESVRCMPLEFGGDDCGGLQNDFRTKSAKNNTNLYRVLFRPYGVEPERREQETGKLMLRQNSLEADGSPVDLGLVHDGKEPNSLPVFRPPWRSIRKRSVIEAYYVATQKTDPQSKEFDLQATRLSYKDHGTYRNRGFHRLFKSTGIELKKQESLLYDEMLVARLLSSYRKAESLRQKMDTNSEKYEPPSGFFRIFRPFWQID